MNTYGDNGNIICLKRRAHWRGIEIIVHPLEIQTPIPEKINLYFFGGGQDAAQASLAEDLVEKKGNRLKEDVQKGIPLLAICGGYQLLGEYYQPFDAERIPGVGIFPVKTEASHDRMIGNLIIRLDSGIDLSNIPSETEDKNNQNTIVGFENHSGKTSLLNPNHSIPLGKVLQGFGNNGDDSTEGCVVNNAIGCYLHGSLLPKNPQLADWLILKALNNIDPTFTLTPIDDQLEWLAHQDIVGRYNL
jgi:CobQ-like glutamine amidotransferase family enzyme